MTKEKRKMPQKYTTVDLIQLIAFMFLFESVLLFTDGVGAVIAIPVFTVSTFLLIYLRTKTNGFTTHNVTLSMLILLCSLNPIRVISDWDFTIAIYLVITLICVIVGVYLFSRQRFLRLLASLVLLCSLLSGWQAIDNIREIGNCHVEDIRWTTYYYCTPTGNGYQQLFQSNIAMTGWCYYCLWYN